MPAKPSKKSYENNPFFIATNGITLLFNLAQGVAVMLIILSVVGLFSGSFGPTDESGSTDAVSNAFSNWGVTEWLFLSGVVGIIGLALLMIGALFAGVNSYTSARIAYGDEVSIRTAFSEAFDKLWSFIWLQIIIFVKVLLWSLLLIIPGIIMAVRYSLASVAFFDDTKNLRGNAAIKESLRLTKGAWLTTYASHMLFNLLTFGIISSVVDTGANAVLYRQYQDAGKKKPAAHWLSWFTLVLPFVLFGFFLLVVILVAVVAGLLGLRFS